MSDEFCWDRIGDGTVPRADLGPVQCPVCHGNGEIFTPDGWDTCPGCELEQTVTLTAREQAFMGAAYWRGWDEREKPGGT